MIGSKLLSQKPVDLNEVKELLAERKKEKDLSYEQDLTATYVKRFSKLSPSQSEKIRKDLAEVEGLSPEIIVKIIDILPERKEVVEMLFPKDQPVDAAKAQKILDIAKKYRK
ncbi:MAG: RNA polymerase Rpb4 family protein [Candidatus Diapherotrites archaeon]|nr:RNA polymerase Rpb4 family protein [Candidatus Diapherotrites archaeon]